MVSLIPCGPDANPNTNATERSIELHKVIPILLHTLYCIAHTVWAIQKYPQSPFFDPELSILYAGYYMQHIPYNKVLIS